MKMAKKLLVMMVKNKLKVKTDWNLPHKIEIYNSTNGTLREMYEFRIHAGSKQKNGEYQKWTVNGKLIQKENYKYGKQHGD
jgi:antitoxin component YwqK of YwqJK toxin-antitoxin module